MGNESRTTSPTARAACGLVLSVALASCNASYGSVPLRDSPATTPQRTVVDLGNKSARRPGGGPNASVIYTFNGKRGAFPYASLIADASGALYGTTKAGGANGAGTVYKLTPSKSGTSYAETLLYSFQDGSDGGAPEAALVLLNNKELYGTTTSGGDHACGCGTVFGLSTIGAKFHVLHTFRGSQGTDGSTPKAALIVDDGNLFGTTEYGGTSGCGGGGCGTTFELNPRGPSYDYQILNSFTGGTGGQFPVSALFINSDKNFLGTTTSGGDMSACGGNGCGTIYGVLYAGTPPSWEFFVFNTFEGGPADGQDPESGLAEANPKGSQSYPYVGTTTLGGANGLGTVYEIWGGPVSKCGYIRFCERVIYSFETSRHDATAPSAGNLVMNAKGVLYGTSTSGGSHNGGAAYKLIPQGSIGPSGPSKYLEEIFFDFGGTFGTTPAAGFLKGPPGKSNSLIGTTSSGANKKGDGAADIFNHELY